MFLALPTSAQVNLNSSSGRVNEIKTDFVFKIEDAQYTRPLLQSGWLSGIGDYLSLKHGGANTEENTFGLRISDAKGFDFGKNNFTNSFFKIQTNGYVGIGTATPSSQLHVYGNTRNTAANPSIHIEGTGTGNYQGANLILSAKGVTTGNKHVSTWFMTHRGTNGTATIEM